LGGFLGGIPETKTFLASQYEIIRAYVLVLHHTTARPGAGSIIGALRRNTERLLVLARDFHDTFHALSRDGNSPADSQQVGARLVAIHREILDMLAGFLQELTGESCSAAQEGLEAQTMMAQFQAALEPSPPNT